MHSLVTFWINWLRNWTRCMDTALRLQTQERVRQPRSVCECAGTESAAASHYAGGTLTYCSWQCMYGQLTTS